MTCDRADGKSRRPAFFHDLPAGWPWERICSFDYRLMSHTAHGFTEHQAEGTIRGCASWTSWAHLTFEICRTFGHTPGSHFFGLRMGGEMCKIGRHVRACLICRSLSVATPSDSRTIVLPTWVSRCAARGGCAQERKNR